MYSVVLLFSLGFVPQAATRERGEEIYGLLQAKWKSARSIAGTMEVRQLDRVEIWHFKFLRPNLAKLTSKEFRFVQDGTSLFAYSVLDNRFSQQRAPAEGLPMGMALNLGGVLGLERFMFGDDFHVRPNLGGGGAFRGRPCLTVSLVSDATKGFSGRLMLDSKTYLPIAWTFKSAGFESSGEFKSLTIDLPLSGAEFSWSAPPGARKFAGMP